MVSEHRFHLDQETYDRIWESLQDIQARLEKMMTPTFNGTAESHEPELELQKNSETNPVEHDPEQDLEKWVDPVVGSKSSDPVFGGSAPPPLKTPYQEPPTSKAQQKPTVRDATILISTTITDSNMWPVEMRSWRSKESRLCGSDSATMGTRVQNTARTRYPKKLISKSYHRARKKGTDISGVLGLEVSDHSANKFMGVNVVGMKKRSDCRKKARQCNLVQAYKMILHKRKLILDMDMKHGSHTISNGSSEGSIQAVDREEARTEAVVEETMMVVPVKVVKLWGSDTQNFSYELEGSITPGELLAAFVKRFDVKRQFHRERVKARKSSGLDVERIEEEQLLACLVWIDRVWEPGGLVTFKISNGIERYHHRDEKLMAKLKENDHVDQNRFVWAARELKYDARYDEKDRWRYHISLGMVTMLGTLVFASRVHSGLVLPSTVPASIWSTHLQHAIGASEQHYGIYAAQEKHLFDPGGVRCVDKAENVLAFCAESAGLLPVQEGWLWNSMIQALGYLIKTKQITLKDRNFYAGVYEFFEAETVSDIVEWSAVGLKIDKNSDYVSTRLSSWSSVLLEVLPPDVQKQLLLHHEFDVSAPLFQIVIEKRLADRMETDKNKHILAAGLNGYIATMAYLKSYVNRWKGSTAPVTAMTMVKLGSQNSGSTSIGSSRKGLVHKLGIDDYVLLKKRVDEAREDSFVGGVRLRKSDDDIEAHVGVKFYKLDFTKQHMVIVAPGLEEKRLARVHEDEPVIKSFYKSEKAHIGQTRAIDDPNLNPCVETAMWVAHIGANSIVAVAGLLHDTVDYSFMSYGSRKNEIVLSQRAFSEESKGIGNGLDLVFISERYHSLRPPEQQFGEVSSRSYCLSSYKLTGQKIGMFDSPRPPERSTSKLSSSSKSGELSARSRLLVEGTEAFTV